MPSDIPILTLMNVPIHIIMANNINESKRFELKNIIWIIKQEHAIWTKKLTNWVPSFGSLEAK